MGSNLGANYVITKEVKIVSKPDETQVIGKIIS